MKKIFMALLLAVVSLGANAQFDKGTKYLSASLSGLDMSYSKNAKFNLGLNALGGYFIEDAWMLYGKLGYDHSKDFNDVNLGAGARYYIKQNGLYLGCGLQYEHINVGNNNFIDLTPEIGYCFYLNHFVSIEPSVYYNMCLNEFGDGSKAGLKVGVGFYF